MAATLTPGERLERFDHELLELERAFVEAVAQLHRSPDVDGSFSDRLAELGDRLRALRHEPAPEDYDKEQLAQLYEALFEIRDRIDTAAEHFDLDTADALLLGIERIRHVVRDALDEHVPGVRDDVAVVTRQLRSRYAT